MGVELHTWNDTPAERVTDIKFDGDLFADKIFNLLTRREEWLRKGTDPRRNINDECGYPEIIEDQMYRDLYERNPIAARVNDVMPRECWIKQPRMRETTDIKETSPFEEAWLNLSKVINGPSWHVQEESNQIWEVLERVDVEAGIMHYGVLLLGVDDGRGLDQPLDGVGDRGEKIERKGKKTPELLYLRAFNQMQAPVTKWVQNDQHPRNGKPEFYDITFVDRQTNDGQAMTGGPVTTSPVKVHWSRVIHVTDNGESIHRPRMKQVFDNLLDLKKLLAGSAEMYYKGAFPGISIESHPSLGADVRINEQRHKDMMEAYMNSLQRYINLFGMSAKSLAPQVSDPTPQIMIQIVTVCIILGCPMRIFMGSERGELASDNDQGTWNGRLGSRQKSHCTPHIIVPFTNRLIMAGVLPEPKGYRVDWEDLNALDDAEKASIALKRTQAMTMYVEGGGGMLMTPIDFLTLVMGFNDEESLMILENLTGYLKDAKPKDATDDPIPGMPMPEAKPPEPFLPPNGSGDSKALKGKVTSRGSKTSAKS